MKLETKVDFITILDKHKVEKAKLFAIAAHEAIGQKRKYTNAPYWIHCQQVAKFVEMVDGSPDMLCAAWLHDVLEDTQITEEVLRQHFDSSIVDMVLGLTDISKAEDGNRAIRKSIDKLHTAKQSADVKTIKLADLLSNTQSICSHDKDFARVYMKEKRELLTVLQEGNELLYREAIILVSDYFEKDI